MVRELHIPGGVSLLLPEKPGNSHLCSLRVNHVLKYLPHCAMAAALLSLKCSWQS